MIVKLFKMCLLKGRTWSVNCAPTTPAVGTDPPRIAAKTIILVDNGDGAGGERGSGHAKHLDQARIPFQDVFPPIWRPGYRSEPPLRFRRWV
jgi:hypothetical protein